MGHQFRDIGIAVTLFSHRHEKVIIRRYDSRPFQCSFGIYICFSEAVTVYIRALSLISTVYNLAPMVATAVDSPAIVEYDSVYIAHGVYELKSREGACPLCRCKK